uniref:Uncharacterized protein n=1 Tax=Arundo donax TaxID=35708 RepID=A0A0A9A910_ARUDO
MSCNVGHLSYICKDLTG